MAGAILKENIRFLLIHIKAGRTDFSGLDAFQQRFGMELTKEAVSGTTLADKGGSSYVDRIKNIDKDESERLKKFEKMVKDQIAKLDYSENEKLVDETNAKIAKEANE